MMRARSTLLACFTAMKSSWNCASSAKASSARSLSRSRSQPWPIFEVMSSLRRGLQASSQRRGVMPLVLLLNLPGYIASKSGKRSFLISWVCSAATPLTE